jgi:hypothetical protein
MHRWCHPRRWSGAEGHMWVMTSSAQSLHDIAKATLRAGGLRLRSAASARRSELVTIRSGATPSASPDGTRVDGACTTTVQYLGSSTVNAYLSGPEWQALAPRRARQGANVVWLRRAAFCGASQIVSDRAAPCSLLVPFAPRGEGVGGSYVSSWCRAAHTCEVGGSSEARCTLARDTHRAEPAALRSDDVPVGVTSNLLCVFERQVCMPSQPGHDEPRSMSSR